MLPSSSVKLMLSGRLRFQAPVSELKTLDTPLRGEGEIGWLFLEAL